MAEVNGTIRIANDVLTDLAGYAALESYGVVGMAAPTLADGMAQLLSKDKLRRGVKITNADTGEVSVDLYVVIEHGTNLAEVSHSLANRVTYDLQNMAGVAVAGVEVHVQGIKVRDK